VGPAKKEERALWHSMRRDSWIEVAQLWQFPGGNASWLEIVRDRVDAIHAGQRTLANDLTSWHGVQIRVTQRIRGLPAGPSTISWQPTDAAGTL